MIPPNFVPIGTTFTSFTNLLIGTSYTASISACIQNYDYEIDVTYTNCGEAFSRIVGTTRLIGPIFAPSVTLLGFTSLEQESNTLNLVWDSAETPATDFYSITYLESGGGGIQSVRVDPYLNSYSIQNLTPATTYFIQAQNFYLPQSSSIYTTSFTTLPDAMEDMFQFNLTTDTVFLNYQSYAATGQGTPSEYFLTLNSGTINRDNSVPINTTLTSFNNLPSSSVFGVSVSACVQNYDFVSDLGPYRNCGQGFSIDAITLDTPPAPVVTYAPSVTLFGFDDIDQGSNTLHLVWDSAATPYADYYSITYIRQTTPRQSQSVVVVPSLDSYTLQNLVPATTYIIQAQNFYLANSSTIYTTSFTTLPDPMVDLYQYNATANSVFVSYTAYDGSRSPGNPTNYLLTLNSGTINLSNTVPFPTTTTSFGGLFSSSFYVASVRACVQNYDFVNNDGPYTNCGGGIGTLVETTDAPPPSNRQGLNSVAIAAIAIAVVLVIIYISVYLGGSSSARVPRLRYRV
jgi:hypothetical protein